jgi:hypothetical protein
MSGEGVQSLTGAGRKAAQQRSDIGKKAIRARWAKKKGQPNGK